jgi:hypothetical protein
MDRVTVYSHHIYRWQLRPGDHIYAWRSRAAGTYAHHGKTSHLMEEAYIY